MPTVKVFFIRHGETVDNVAGLYAGVRDSALTNHGVDQAQRLGSYLARESVKLTHIFSSPLQRTLKTAEAVRAAQPRGEDGTTTLDINQVPELIEQDFGFYEGKPFYTRSASSPRKSGKDMHRERHRDEPGFVDVESKESMAKRADTFLDQHLLPLLDVDQQEDLTVALVSHGMLLSSLWKRLLLRLPKKSLSIAPAVIAARGEIILEHLGGWSNTGYLELVLAAEPENDKVHPLVETIDCPNPNSSGDTTANKSLDGGLSEQAESVSTSSEPAVALDTLAPPPAVAEMQETADPNVRSTRVLQGWSTSIVAIDSKQHLTGLKRQRGGIGRLAYDEGQKKLDGFFKKQRKT